MISDPVRIGSRGSELALWQARWVQQELRARDSASEIVIEIIKTTGDNILDSPLSAIGDKGLFTGEIENSLLAGEIDLAVHSLKDLPTELPEGLMIGAICEREDVRDVFIPHPHNPCTKLLGQPPGSRIATGSLRRKCQLLNLRPDFEIIDLRGNLDTRLRKLEVSDWAGMMLAQAGVIRLGWTEIIGDIIEADIILPAVGQGALGIEVRIGDARIARRVSPLTHLPTYQATTAERALLRRLEGGCQVPIGAYGRVQSKGREGPELRLDAVVGSLNGQTLVRGKMHGNPREAESIGRRLAETLLAMGADRILHAIRLPQSDHHEFAG
jgi:hydroxymethylbilane synthase